MAIEAPGPTPNPVYHETQRLETLLLIILEENNGFCLDTEKERRHLAAILASALIAASHGTSKAEIGRSRWPEPTTEHPDLETLEQWELDDEGCEATDGCWVEINGVCEHGHPSWLLWLGDD